MKNKHFLCIFLALCIAVCGTLTGCSGYEKKQSDKLSVVTTCFPPYDFVRAVTGENADIEMLLCPGAEAHSYEPTPLDIAEIQQCDVFVYIGGEGEVWADKLLGSLDTSDMTVIRLFDFVEPLPEEDVAGASPNGHHHHDGGDEEEHHDEEEHDGDADEHIWTSPVNASLCVEGIAETLCKVDSANTEIYRRNASAYSEQLHQLDEEFRSMTENAPNDVIVIGDRFPFRYLTNDYGLEYFAAFSGCSSESEPGVYTMAFLIDEIKEHSIDTVFYLEFSTKKLAEKLCSATGAEMLPLHSCHNVSRDDFESGVAYIELMRQNLNNLREALY